MTSQKRRPRVFVHETITFRGTSLSQIVEEAGCELVPVVEERELCDALDRVLPPLALIMLSLDPEPSRTFESVARLRNQRDWLAEIPMLGVTSLARFDVDYQRLRALGLVGLVDAGAPPEHVRFRVGQIAHKEREGRRFERVPCCIPVEVEVEGERSTAYATSLSAGGLGLTCSRRIEPNTLVGLHFALEEGKKPISVSGRTVRLAGSRRPGADYEIGLFFHRLPEKTRDEISATVSRLLAAWDTVSATGLLGTVDPVVVADSTARGGDPVPRSMRASQAALLPERLRAPHARSWARRLSSLAVMAIAAVALAPLTVDYVREHRKAQALRDSRILGRAILAFYLDTGVWPVNNDSEPHTGELSRLVGLPGGENSAARIPGGAGSAGNWAGGGDGGDAGAIEDHLIRNERVGLGPIYSMSRTAPDPPGWNGPYLKSVPVDPWGRPYVCNARYLIGAGIAGVTDAETSNHAVLCLSAGPNGAFETPLSDDTELSDPSGDDVGWAIQARAMP